MQAMQDHHLNEYLEWVAHQQGRTRADFEEKELDAIAFPDNLEAMTGIFRRFLIGYYTDTEPRSKLNNDNISYGELTRVGDILHFWVRYKRLRANKPPIIPPILFPYMLEAMRAARAMYPNLEVGQDHELKAYCEEMANDTDRVVGVEMLESLKQYRRLIAAEKDSHAHDELKVRNPLFSSPCENVQADSSPPS
jgi:hypothetical protein